jgi:hypothetical protein
MDKRRTDFTSAAKVKSPLPDGSTKLAAKEKKSPENMRPIIPNDVEERFWYPARQPADGNRLVYRPGLLVTASCHYVRTSAGVDDWIDRAQLFIPKRSIPDDIWRSSVAIPSGTLELGLQPEPDYGFSDPPAEFLNDKQIRAWEKDARDHFYRRVPIRIFECKALDAFSRPGEDELDARLNWKQLIRERRDEEKEVLREAFAKKIKALESKIRTAQQRLEREKAQYDQQKWSTVLNFGQTVLGAIMGNKIASRSATTGRSAGRAAQQRTDVVHANETLADLEMELRTLKDECEEAIAELQNSLTVEGLDLEPLEISCRKGDLKIDYIGICWLPWEVDANGIAVPLVNLPK